MLIVSRLPCLLPATSSELSILPDSQPNKMTSKPDANLPLVKSLREEDSHLKELENKNFGLKLQSYYDAKNSGRNRNSSSSLPPDSFYDESSDGSRNSNVRADIMDPDKKIELLKGELNEARGNYEKLLYELNQVRQENDELAIKAEQKGREYENLSSDFQKKANELQNRKDEYNKKLAVFKKELHIARNKANEIKSVAEEARRERGEANRRYEISQKKINEIQIRSDGLQMEKEVIQAALTETEASLYKEKSRAKKKEDALLRTEQLARETEQILVRERALREEADRLVSQKAVELESALTRANDYLNDREAIKAALKAAIQKADTWEKANELMEDGKRFFAAESEIYQDLKRTIEDGEAKFAVPTTYNPKWREDVAGHFNSCLKMLGMMEAETQSRMIYVLKLGSKSSQSVGIQS
eukprot:gb/GEZJ01002560.1/.p1 GENE.gb/GEZJ01002560.1/~~gb/GEZJ01002560.1/.p1  ORF type:complete len:417 (+),score=88.66 gb/GEZJ01002560.1/:404-1654(+)